MFQNKYNLVIPAKAGTQSAVDMDTVYAVYIMASRRNGTLYTGVTSDLLKRVWMHKHDVLPGFTSKYKVHRLVWYEIHVDVREAILREKRIKEWKRAWKLKLIEDMNPDWEDLYDGLTGSRLSPG